MADKTKNRKKRLGKGLGGLLSSPVAVPVHAASKEDAKKDDQGVQLNQGATPSTSMTTESGATASETIESVTNPKPTGNATTGVHGEGLVYIDASKITPNPHQPRQVFDDDAIASLADSINTAGLMQPIIVRSSNTEQGTFEIIAGERRWRAGIIAGLIEIPSIVRELDDRAAAEWALIENLQREDLNPIDRAEAFDHLIVTFEMTQKDIATQLGIDRSSVANFLRLNDLETSIKDAVRDGRLSMGHAKVLLSIPDVSTCKAVARKCASQQWSVRELERQLKKQGGDKKTMVLGDDPQAMYMEHLAGQLGDHLGTKVHISLGKKKGSGKVSIDFYDNDQFEGILDRLQFKPVT